MYRDPVNATTYDLVVIGGGTAGLVCAAGAATLGARVALVEKDRLGGECLNTGCVPSKALLAAARDSCEFAAAMARVDAAIRAIEPHDSATRLSAAGVRVVFGRAAFRSKREVVVGEEVLRFKRAVIATGSRPALPDIPGLAGTPYLTNETIFAGRDQPASLAILGGGPEGCEMAQAFARLGTRVTLIEAGPRLLPRDDADAVAILHRHLEADGIEVLTATRVMSAEQTEEGIRLTHAGGRVSAAALLVAAGRTPHVHGLGLDSAGIECGEDGVRVDDHLRTSNRRVFASGDCCSRMRFTHAADAMSRIVIQNALFHRRLRASALVIPWCTFTAPEVAHVGVSAQEAQRDGCATMTIPFDDVDRAIIDGHGEGFVRVHHARGILRGATVVGAHAGELISTLSVLLETGGRLADLSATVFPYPTLSEALKRAGDNFRRESLTPGVRSALRTWFRLLR